MANNFNFSINKTRYIDANQLDFRTLHQSYIMYTKNIIDVPDSIEDPQYKNNEKSSYYSSVLPYALAWVESAGERSFNDIVTENDFYQTMNIIKNHKGKSIEECREVIGAYFIERGQRYLIDIFYTFIKHPLIYKTYNIFGVEKEDSDNLVFAKNAALSKTSEENQNILNNYYITVSDNSLFTNVQKEENKQEQKVVFNSDVTYKQEMQMPELEFSELKNGQFFDINSLFYYLDKVDYDGKNLEILDDSIMDDPNIPNAKTLAKLGLISRLWSYTCTQLEPNADENRLNEINQNLFNNKENNQKVLMSILDLVFNKDITDAKELIEQLKNEKVIQEDEKLLKKSTFFLDNLENFGGLKLGLVKDDSPEM